MKIIRDAPREGLGVQSRQISDGRLPADAGVVLPDFSSPAGREKSREHRARQPRKGKLDDVRVGKKVVEERLDRVERVRPAELEQHDANATAVQPLPATHSPDLLPARLAGAGSQSFSNPARPLKRRTMLHGLASRVQEPWESP